MKLSQRQPIIPARGNWTYEASGAVGQAAVLWRLTEKLRLQREDVVEHAINAPALQAMLDHPSGTLEVTSQRRPKQPVDARLSFHLGLFQQLEAAVEGKLPGSMGNLHVRPFR